MRACVSDLLLVMPNDTLLSSWKVAQAIEDLGHKPGARLPKQTTPTQVSRISPNNANEVCHVSTHTHTQ